MRMRRRARKIRKSYGGLVSCGDIFPRIYARSIATGAQRVLGETYAWAWASPSVTLGLRLRDFGISFQARE